MNTLTYIPDIPRRLALALQYCSVIFFTTPAQEAAARASAAKLDASVTLREPVTEPPPSPAQG